MVAARRASAGGRQLPVDCGGNWALRPARWPCRSYLVHGKTKPPAAQRSRPIGAVSRNTEHRCGCQHDSRATHIYSTHRRLQAIGCHFRCSPRRRGDSTRHPRRRRGPHGRYARDCRGTGTAELSTGSLLGQDPADIVHQEVVANGHRPGRTTRGAIAIVRALVVRVLAVSGRRYPRRTHRANDAGRRCPHGRMGRAS
jgi:hypothetical protein